MRRIDDIIDAKLQVDDMFKSTRTNDSEAAWMQMQMNGYTDAEICRHFGRSHNWVTNIKKQLRSKWS